MSDIPSSCDAFRSDPLRPARQLLATLRAVPAQVSALRCSGTGPLAVFLPARATVGREGAGASGAAHLRVGCLAAALPDHGWRSFVVPWRLSLAQRRQLLRWLNPDVVVMQGVRHALNRPGLYPGQRIVLDVDDADFHLPHLALPMRQAMSDIAGVIAGSRYVADWCRSAGAPQASVVWTGTPPSPARRPSHAIRRPVIAWAQSRPADYRDEAAQVLRVMRQVAAKRGDVRLRLYDRRPGDDDSLLAPFRAAGITTEWLPNMAYGDYLASFDDVMLGLAPVAAATPFSRGKSFGKVLAYLDRHVPVIASDMADHGAFFTPATGVITNDETLWVSEVLRLLGDGPARQRMALATHAAFRDHLTTAVAAERTADVLSGLLGLRLAPRAAAPRSGIGAPAGQYG